MAVPMKIQANINGEFTEAKIFMTHPMETGLRVNAAGKGIPAHYISEVTATVAGRTVLQCHFSQFISQNPYLVFKFRGGVKGGKLQVVWTDNKGEKRMDETIIS